MRNLQLPIFNGGRYLKDKLSIFVRDRVIAAVYETDGCITDRFGGDLICYPAFENQNGSIRLCPGIQTNERP